MTKAKSKDGRAAKKCATLTKTGTPCQNQRKSGSRYCYLHGEGRASRPSKRTRSVKNKKNDTGIKITMVARSGRKWDYLYLNDLGIGFEDVHEYKKFFGEGKPEIFNRQNIIKELLACNLETFDYNDNTPDIVMYFLKKLNNVVNLNQRNESAVDDLAKILFSVVGLDREKDINIHGPTKIEYLISGEEVEASPDVVVQKSNSLLLVVQEDKSYKVTELDKCKEAEPQLVAEMLGAFYMNSQENQGQLKSQWIYGVVMLGSYCTFYKFRITRDIITRVVGGKKCDDVINHVYRYRLGAKNPRFMLNRDNLLLTLQCYESLRKIIILQLE